MAQGDDEILDAPRPGKSVLENLPGLAASHREIYRFLFENRDRPPTMSEIRDEVSRELGPQTQTDRRVRDLYRFFRIDKVRLERDPSPGYRLAGMWHAPKRAGVAAVSGRVRAQVLAPKRCAQCGRTPLDDGVRLVVDHKIPQHWGGTDELDNLQPLCEECNGGKQAWYATYDEHAERIQAAIAFPEPHKRIGELLKAFEGEWVPSELIGVAASAGSYQEDWQKRMRELRTIGWVIEFRRERDAASTRRTRTYYRAVVAPEWPEGPVRAAITDAERRRRDSRPGD